MGGVGGVILDESVLLVDSDHGNGAPILRTGADFLFRTVQFSQLRKGICFGNDLSADKVNFLKETSKENSFDCFSFSSSPMEVFKNESEIARGDAKLRTLYVISHQKKDICHELYYGLSLAVLDVDNGGDTNKHPHMLHIKKLEELPLNICRLNRKAAHNELVTVGYSMKLSRQADFAKRGAFPLYCSEHDLMFLPLTYELPIPLQLQEIDVVLHKAADDIVSIEMNTSGNAPKITYTRGMEELSRYLYNLELLTALCFNKTIFYSPFCL